VRTTGFLIGILLLVIGAGFGLADLIMDGTQSLGGLWFALHPNSLVGFQAIVEKQLAPALWPPIQWLLTQPGWPLFLIPGGLLLVLCRPRGQPG
jgi:hypothetical protein